jgi:hypothetical protein
VEDEGYANSTLFRAPSAIDATSVTASAALTNYDGFDYSGTSLNTQSGRNGLGRRVVQHRLDLRHTLQRLRELELPGTFESRAHDPAHRGIPHLHGRNCVKQLRASSLRPSNLAQDGNVMYVSALVPQERGNGSAVNDNILLEFVDSVANRVSGRHRRRGRQALAQREWFDNTLRRSGSNSRRHYFIIAKIVSSATGSDSAFLKVYGTGYGSQVPVAEPTTWMPR